MSLPSPVATPPPPPGPAPGTDEHANLTRAYQTAVERVAKLRAYEAKLPAAIHEEQARVDQLARRLGLKSAEPRAPKQRRSRQTRPLVVNALRDGVTRPRAIADHTGLRIGLVTSMLGCLRKSGVAVRGVDGTWRLVDQKGGDVE